MFVFKKKQIQKEKTVHYRKIFNKANKQIEQDAKSNNCVCINPYHLTFLQNIKMKIKYFYLHFYNISLYI